MNEQIKQNITEEKHNLILVDSDKSTDIYEVDKDISSNYIVVRNYGYINQIGIDMRDIFECDDLVTAVAIFMGMDTDIYPAVIFVKDGRSYKTYMNENDPDVMEVFRKMIDLGWSERKAREILFNEDEEDFSSQEKD